MRLQHRAPTSPGTMLTYFIEEYGLTQAQFAAYLEGLPDWMNQLCSDEQPITAEIALCLSDAFSHSPEFWLNGQQEWSLWHAERSHQKRTPLRLPHLSEGSL